MEVTVHLDALGYFCLGVFVGTITSFSINFLENAKSSLEAVKVILPAALGGVATTFLQSMEKTNHGMPSYAIGLLIGLMWIRAQTAIELIQDKLLWKRCLGVLHIASVIIASIFAFFIFVSFDNFALIRVSS